MWRHSVLQKPIILHDKSRSHKSAAVTDLLRSWQWEILEHPPYSPDMSPCDYHLMAKVKEPLRGTRYNTRNELIRAIGQSVRNINKDGSVDDIRSLPNIWQKVINKRTTIMLKVHKKAVPLCCTPCEKCRTVAITFHPTHLYIIFIQKRCSSFVNMVLGRSGYPHESQRSTHCSRLTECCHRWLY